MHLSSIPTEDLVKEVIKRLTETIGFSGNLQLNCFKGGLTNFTKLQVKKLNELVELRNY